MSLEYFEGPAGSGKTYRLTKAVDYLLQKSPLAEDQVLLAVTFMHGSRRRMHDRLASVRRLRGRFVACTVDSLARTIVGRWRSLAKTVAPTLDIMQTPDFDRTCSVAAQLLKRDYVAEWLRHRYPAVVADELQDCHGDRLAIMQALEAHCHLLAAADFFQDLRCTGENPAVEWLHHSAGCRTVLDGNNRTKQKSLLDAAQRLRAGGDLQDSLGGGLMEVFNANVGAGRAAATLAWKGVTDAVILTPTGPDKSPFVHDL